MMDTTNNKLKATGAVLGAVVLAGSAAAAVQPAFAQDDASASVDSVSVASSEHAGYSERVSVAHADGSFSYNQSVVASCGEISNTFAKAAAVLCSSLPKYDAGLMALPISVANGNHDAFSATVQEMVEQGGSESLVMGCACASNVPGGGAAVNAEVEGIPLEVVLVMAGVK